MGARLCDALLYGERRARFYKNAIFAWSGLDSLTFIL